MKTEERDGISLRLPPGMRQRIKVSAAKNQRTMNAEVVFRLERDFARENESPAGIALPPGHNQSHQPATDEGRDDRQ